MANCEENSCANVQSAICLHCNRRLCAPHIVAHGTVLLEEADELCAQINNVAEDLTASLQQIQTTHNEAVDAVNVWRQREIDKIEDKYAEKVQTIESRQDYLIELENKLSKRLAKTAREPLERMQIQKNANSEVVQSIREAIADIKQESKQLEWHEIESLNQSPSFNIENMAISTRQQIQFDDQHQHQSNLVENHTRERAAMYSSTNQWHPPYQTNQSSVRNLSPLIRAAPLVNVFSNTGYRPVIRPQFEYNQTRIPILPHWPHSTAASPIPPYQFWHPPPPTPVASRFVPLRQASTISTGLQIDIKRLPTNSCKRLVVFFMNVSGSNDPLVNDFITNNLNSATHVNNIMLVLLSFLEAWHSKNSPTIFNERVLSYHIFTVQKYIKGRDHEITAIAAIVVFINTCGYDEIKSGRIMTILLHHFFDHKCITKTTILDWYQNGVSYGFDNFQTVKLWAKPFIDQLNTVVQSEQT